MTEHNLPPQLEVSPEAPDRNLALELVRVTEAAAMAAGRWVGRGDKLGADGAAVNAMRTLISTVSMNGVVVAGIYMFVPHDENADPTHVVDYRVETATARRAAPYPVAAPVGLPAEWRATSVSYERKNADAWHLGFLDPDKQYVAVEQSNGEAAKFISETTLQSQKDGTQRIAGRTWDRYDGGRYRALVERGDGVTTMVTGTAPFDQLARLAAALRTS